jgi:regulator of protease activity HflC (stomatin/prohibitin superfamily)
MLLLNLGLLLGSIAWLVFTLVGARQMPAGEVAGKVTAAVLLEGVAILLLVGHFTLQPNEARLLILFGAYRGTVRSSGFFWANPLYARMRGRVPLAPKRAEAGAGAAKTSWLTTGTGGIVYQALPSKISCRAHNFTSEKLKVNDKRGNPIEIAVVVVWRVEDTAKAAFDVEDYESYVQIQSEAAIRHIATLYAYDRGDEHEPTLRESGDEVATELKRELQERLARAGVVVEEARITHLAYAPEIAHAMLRRQQAEAVIAARQKIVHGAVSMVDQALRELAEKEVVKLDDERKAAMVSNLLVVLCGEAEASPVINTGTLYP